MKVYYSEEEMRDIGVPTECDHAKLTFDNPLSKCMEGLSYRLEVEYERVQLRLCKKELFVWVLRTDMSDVLDMLGALNVRV